MRRPLHGMEVTEMPFGLRITNGLVKEKSTLGAAANNVSYLNEELFA